MIEKIFISKNSTIKGSLDLLGKSGHKCLIVVDKNKKLLGTLSDGDIRKKGILKGMVIKDLISDIYENNPTYLLKNKYSTDEVKKIFIDKKFDLIPIVDSDHKVVDVLFWDKIFKNQEYIIKRKQLDASVVIMAGGRGTRLEPFTNVLPKPLIPIHDKPIIEYIIENFTKAGINKFYFTVNYKGLILKAYFKEMKPQYFFEFIEEKKPLGTAGSLRYLKDKMDNHFFVSNCDIIIETDLKDLFRFHLDNKFDVTLVASAKEFVIPYGTCVLNGDGYLSHINEKPQFDFLINTGLYILKPDILSIIPENRIYHFTDLIKDAKNNGAKVGVYPIDDDSWIDVGQWTEYKKAVEKL